MRTLLLVGTTIALLLACGRASALDVGSRLPALNEVAWLGAPVDPAGAFTVVDLWSPENPACRAIMPRLTDLQRRHPEVRVIGLTAAPREEAERFVTGMGARVGYAIGVVSSLAPFAPPVGTPSAVLLDRSGNVLWWGDAMDVVEPLSRALTGTFVPVSLTPPSPPAAEAPRAEPATAPVPSERPQSRVEVRERTRTVVVVEHPWWWSVDACGGPCISRVWLPRPPLPLLVPLPPLPPLLFPTHHHHW
jgi:thiol-disulfide isomerase/thioredoxin